MDIAQFRKDFTEFSDVARYPTALVSSWSTLAEQITSADIYGTSYAWAVKLCTAHFITLGQQNALVASNGGMPGQVGGVVSSKSVGDVSVSYDTNIGSMSGDAAGQWNATSYGRQYLTLARLFAAGVVQL